MHTAWPRRGREAWKDATYERRNSRSTQERYNEASEKEKRERGRERGDEERHRAMCTTALLLRSMCQCVSRWRPVQVDGLVFGRRRRRSVGLGTRSVMESLAAPSVEAMTPSTPLLPPNARRFPSVSPLGVSYRGYSVPHHGSAARYHPSDCPLPCPIALPLNLIVTPAHKREERRERGRDGEPPTPRAADGCSARHARDARAEPALLEFSESAPNFVAIVTSVITTCDTMQFL